MSRFVYEEDYDYLDERLVKKLNKSISRNEKREKRNLKEQGDAYQEKKSRRDYGIGIKNIIVEDKQLLGE